MNGTNAGQVLMFLTLVVWGIAMFMAIGRYEQKVQDCESLCIDKSMKPGGIKDGSCICYDEEGHMRGYGSP